MSLHTKDVNERTRILQTLKTETEDIKNRLVAVSARCHELENMKSFASQDYKPTSDVETIQELLRDALEKNQQWLAYDQQREAYMTTVLTRLHLLEQQQGLPRGAFQERPPHTAPDTDTARNSLAAQQQQYTEVLQKCEEQLDQEFESIAQAQREVEHLKREAKETHQEVCTVQGLLQSKQNDLERTQMHIDDKKVELDMVWQQIKEKNGDLSEMQELLHTKFAELQALQAQIQVTEGELRELRLEKSQIQKQLKDHKAELKQDMTLQEVLHRHQEEQARTASLQKQVSCLADDVQEQKCEKQHLQKQLQKALKDLRKAHSYISKLEDEVDKVPSKLVSCEEKPQAVQERQEVQESHVRRSYESPRASPGLPSPLDESFLECPNCQKQYPASRHRELVTHLDQCCR